MSNEDTHPPFPKRPGLSKAYLWARDWKYTPHAVCFLAGFVLGLML